ncbi:MAG: FecR domain-containing protein, partial [Deltaproteobacteria bacterium]|nr:FecR domain-containing protein [Deltaproteobacteria bacterium]
MSKKTDDPNVLERNVSTLLEAGGEAPRIADGARSRIRAQLMLKHGKDGVRKGSPLIAIGLGLAATAAGAFVVTRIAGSPASETPTTPDGSTDGATWIAHADGKVEKLGARKLRVTGAALIDVEPGKGTFTVETAQGTIEVIGTRFVVDASADRTSTAVVRGSVKLASAAGSVVLHAGEQGIAEHSRPPTRGPAPRLSHLVSWAEQARKKVEHAVKPLRNGTLFAREPNTPWVPETPLPIVKLGVDVVVEDQVARVAIDQTFHNPNPRVMEGMYRFAIPPDASLQRLAMYVEGKLTESAVVERMQARRIYEDVVYRRLDPALLEWAGTGRLSLKVYPLFAQQDKRLLIAYTQSLPKLYDDYTLTVPLPEVDLPVGELAFDVRMKGCANCEVTSTSHKIAVKRSGSDSIVSYRQGNVDIGDSLVLHVRDTRRNPIVASHKQAGDDYVMVRARPDLEAKAREYRKKTWVILDDVSASRDALTRRAQHDMIDGFLRELDEDDRVSIIAFDVAARTKLAPTRVLDVDRKAVRAALADEGNIGATDFGVALDAALVQLADQRVDPEDANIVYLGDGIISSGPRQLDRLRAKLAGKAHFIGVGIGDGPDTQTLESLAAASGGYATTLDLADDLGWRAFDLVAALHTPRVAGLEGKLIDANGNRVPATVYIKTPQLADGEELELVAKLASITNTATAVELTGTLNGKPWKQNVALAGGTDNAGYLPRLWAQQHISARLLAKHDPVVVPPCAAPEPQAKITFPDPQTRRPQTAEPVCKTEGEVRDERDEGIRKDIVALGKQYFLLSRHTSLLVLENDAMYQKYGVEKGKGDTWAPYVVPEKIEVVSRVAVTPDIASDAELLRRPMQIFYNAGYYDPGFMTIDAIGGLDQQAFRGARGTGTGNGFGFSGSRRDLGLANKGPMREEAKADKSGASEGESDLDTASASPAAPPADDGELRKELRDSGAPKASEKQERTMVFADELGGQGGGGRFNGDFKRIGGAVAGKQAKPSAFGWGRPIGYPTRLGYPTDAAYDDLTNFMPALSADAFDSWRKELEIAAAGQKTHAMDAASRTLLDAARRAVPAGVYRWGELEIAVDPSHRIGWRRTTGADLAETASYDGATWTRRYGELGVDVTRPIGDASVALQLAYLPLWIAEPAHYARWFEVSATKNAREVALSRLVAGGAGKPKPELAFVMVFDTNNHLTAIRDAKGNDLVAITWNSIGPTTMRSGGVDTTIGYSGLPISDATSWAHSWPADRSTATGVAVEMPMRLATYWDAKLKTMTAGTAEWRHAQRQRMASLAAVNDRSTLGTVLELLRANGGVELGDLALGSGGLAGATTDVQFAKLIEKHAQAPLVQYLQAGRLYTQNQKSERLKAKTSAGFIGALWTIREAMALFVADKDSQAVDRVLSLGERAPELRLVGVGASTNRYQLKPADITRLWDSIAKGENKNIARAQAAQLLANRGQYDAAAERVVALIEDLDLAVAPPTLQSIQYHFQQSRRGQAGWQLVWA